MASFSCNMLSSFSLVLGTGGSYREQWPCTLPLAEAPGVPGGLSFLPCGQQCLLGKLMVVVLKITWMYIFQCYALS